MSRLIETTALKMIGYFGDDIQRINHALKVHAFAMTIAGGEDLSNEQRTVLEVAALLHDIGIQEAERQYHSTAGHYQEELGPGIARELMEEEALDGPALERILYLIGHHHSYGEIDALDFQILVEADFLVNIFEDKMTKEQISVIGERYFKTLLGRSILAEMYLK